MKNTVTAASNKIAAAVSSVVDNSGRIRIMEYRPKKDARVTHVKNDLSAMQRLVEGPIEVVHITAERPNLVAVLNEEGKIRGLEVCCFWVEPNSRTVLDMLCGDFFVCSTDGEDFSDLSDDDISYLQQNDVLTNILRPRKQEV